MKKLTLITAMVISVVVIKNARADKEFSRLCVFGDSLSSVTIYNGYKPNRLGSGNNWPYHLRPLILSEGGAYENFALGGLKSYAILQTIYGYVSLNPRLDPEGLYAIYGGTNDRVADAGNIVTGVNVLHDAGAKYILVSNLHRSASDLDTFNNDLKTRLSDTEANVIMADNHALVNELKASPSSYGFTSEPVLVDELHYSDYASSILAQYFQSIIQAPLQISILPEFPGYAAFLNNDRLDTILNRDRLDSPVSDPGEADDRKFSFFAEAGAGIIDISAKDEFAASEMTGGNVILAGSYPIIENLKSGIGLNIAYGGGDFGEGKGDFTMFNGIISLFAGFDINETIPVTLILSQGFYNFDDITRLVELGSLTRSCRGSTTGATTGLAVKIRYNFRETASSNFGSILGLDYEKIAVNGYTEGENQSTSMKFGSQDTERTTGSLGLIYDYLHEYTWARVRYSVRGDYLYVVGGDSRTISARVSSFDNSFEMPAYSAGDYSSVRLTLEADFVLTSGFTGTCAYQLLYSDVSMINSLRLGLTF